MHYLTRPSSPSCLGNYNHGSNTWNDLTPEDKQEIRDQLQTMQATRCAYCERSLPAKIVSQEGKEREVVDAHIEHFRQKNSSVFPQGTFLWDNLFWSCNDSDSCGRHKDNKIGSSGYDHRDLIKMDDDDPDDFLHFLSDGTISTRVDLSTADKKRAGETLRVFNLDPLHGDLRARRKEAVRPFLTNAKTLADLAETHAFDDIKEFYLEMVDDIRNLEFCTPIRHAILPADLHKTIK